LGELQGGTEGEPRLTEAVEAHQRALTVYTLHDFPQPWARTQNNLGAALQKLGELQRGVEGVRQLSKAVEAFRLALTVRTRVHFPQQWARTQKHLGTALQIQLGLDGFLKGLEQIDRLSQAEAIRDDPVAQASLRTLALVCSVATDRDAEASRAFAALVALVERQPADFQLVWDWAPLRKLIAESQVPSLSARRGSLQNLIDAVDHKNKAAMLAGLKELQDAFTARAEVPKKPKGS
jgi:hypothetical protein